MAECKHYPDGTIGVRNRSGRMIKYECCASCAGCGEPFLSEHFYKNGQRVFNTYCSVSCRSKNMVLSDETHHKMVVSHLGKPVSPETRRKLSAASRGRPMPLHVSAVLHSPEAKLKARAGRDAHVALHGGNLKPAQHAAKHNHYRHYINKAANRGLIFELTKDEFLDITSKPCHYCGVASSITVKNHACCTTDGFYVCNGVDRVDSSKGYTLDNVVPCCTQCNIAKLNKNIAEFLIWVLKTDLFLRNKPTSLTYFGDIIEAQQSVMRVVFGEHKRRRKHGSKDYIVSTLSIIDFARLIRTQCFYCGGGLSNARARTYGRNRKRPADGVVLEYNGLDRIDPDGGYTLENVVPCCATCNRAKLDYSQDEFYTWVTRVANHIRNTPELFDLVSSHLC